ncbi:DnaB-like helicase N-terminal domain-containing protein [Streptomyces erythrochromogenes]|uniref:DnaB-like helicase N-terminal domain-containing protein n=1 Tax=Streptomyces erythrochromogenes TaxID=285574 RepID=UPI003816CD4A
MGRWKKPTLPEGPLRTLNHELHSLHHKAGNPSARELQRAVGKVVSHTKIHHAFIKPQVPAWGLVEVVVEQLAKSARPRLAVEEEVNRFKTLWDAATIAAEASSVPTTEPSQGTAPITFSEPRNALIYAAIVDLYRTGKATGVHDVADELARRGQLEVCGGEDYLFECVKMAMKGAYDAGVSISEFTALSARRVRAAADDRDMIVTAVVSNGPPGSSWQTAYRRFVAQQD